MAFHLAIPHFVVFLFVNIAVFGQSITPPLVCFIATDHDTPFSLLERAAIPQIV